MNRKTDSLNPQNKKELVNQHNNKLLSNKIQYMIIHKCSFNQMKQMRGGIKKFNMKMKFQSKPSYC